MSSMQEIADDLHLDLPGDRVREHTTPEINQRIDATMQATVTARVQQGPKAIERRLAELDREWDIDRALMVAFSAVGGAVFLKGIRRYADASPFGERPKGLLYLFGTQLGFLALHGVVGWCPPASVLRRLGFRTAREIESERRQLERALADARPSKTEPRNPPKTRAAKASNQAAANDAASPKPAARSKQHRARTHATAK
jgi:hypothetical protein